MKYFGLLSIILLVGCQSVPPAPTFCESEPDSNLCDQRNYPNGVVKALEEFELKRKHKAFALVKTSKHWLHVQAYDARTAYKARKKALYECQEQLDERGWEGKCELIR